LHTLPVHPTSIILNEAVVGAVYSEDPAKFPAVEKQDETGYITFLLMEWKQVCRPTRIFTPMSFFDGDHAHQWKKDLAHCVRTSAHFSILFDTTTGVVVYAYDWITICDFVVQPPVSGVELPCLEMIYPRLRVTYELIPEQSAPSFSVQDAWSHACLLWDGQRVGILGYHISEELARPLLSLSVLDLSPLLIHDDGIPNYDLQEEYLRRYTDDGTSHLSNYTTRSNSFLGSQPRNATNTTWVLESWDGPNVMSALALARYMPQDALQAGGEIESPHASPLKITDGGVEIPATQQPLTEHQDLETKRKEQFLQINLEGWIPESEQAEDIDLDDRLGRVVFGMNSGKVYILEFV
jgi:hypothetical protein